MFYCPVCMQLREMERCPSCGRFPLYPPHPKDFCFLLEKEAMWAEMLREVLRDQGIPCVHQPVYGAGLIMNVGAAMERYRLFVPYEFLDEAQEMAKQLFAGPQTEEEY